MPNRFARRVNNWGKKSKSEEYGKNPKSLNKTKYKYDWYNYEQEEVEVLVKYDVHNPDNNAEITGIDLDSE